MNKHIKQSVVLFIASALSVVLGVATSVFNTSMLSPSSYGDVRYVNNIINFVASLLLFGYFVSGSRMLALSNNEDKNRRIRGLMLIILLIASVVLTIGVVLCYFLHKEWLNPNVAPLFLYVLPVSIAPLLLSYINTVFQGDNSIYKLSIARVLPHILYVIFAWLFLYNANPQSSDVLLLQNGISVLVLLVLIFLHRPMFKGLSSIYRELAEENKSYGIHIYIGSIAAVSLSYLAGITIGIFNEDNTNVGFYTLALTIATPLSILPTIIGTTYFKKFASQSCIDKKLLIGSVALSFASLLLFVILIDPIVDLLYNDSYSSVAVYAKWLAIGTVAHGLGDMFNRFLGSHGKGKELRNGAFLCGITMLIGNIVLVYFFGVNGAIATRIIASSVYCLTMVMYYIKFVNK